MLVALRGSMEKDSYCVSVLVVFTVIALTSPSDGGVTTETPFNVGRLSALSGNSVAHVGNKSNEEDRFTVRRNRNISDDARISNTGSVFTETSSVRNAEVENTTKKVERLFENDTKEKSQTDVYNMKMSTTEKLEFYRLSPTTEINIERDTNVSFHNSRLPIDSGEEDIEEDSGNSTMKKEPRMFQTSVHKISQDDSTSILNSDFENINETQACNIYLSVVIKRWELFDNESLLALDDTSMLYPPNMYWRHEGKEIRGCLCLLRDCVRKCCPEGQTLLYGEECAPSNMSLLHPFEPEFYDDLTDKPVKNPGIYIVYGNPCSPNGSYQLDPTRNGAEEQYELLTNGMLKVPYENTKMYVDQYCIEAFDEQRAILPLACFPDEEESPLATKENSDIYLLYPVGMIISLPFLLATFFVYAVIPELRNLHGKSLMCHVSSLFTAYVFLAIVQLGGNTLSNEFCVFCAFAIFFAFHANFFWLNVMCFDIWWTFSGLRPLRGSVKERERKKFLMYSCYAWGAPLVMLIVCMIMDLLPGIPDSYLKPKFGTDKCWFNTETAVLAYFFGPIGVLIFCNMILFIVTALKILALKRETKMLKAADSRRHDDETNRQRFNLYLKLFIVMGVNWVMEVISWAARGPNYLWYITDLGNTLQGLLIFVIFVCKHKVHRLLVKRFCPKLSGSSSSPYDNSTRSRPTPSRGSSYGYSYTARTSLESQDQVHMKPIGSYRNSDVP